MFADIRRFVNALRRRNPRADTAKSYRYHLHTFATFLDDPPAAAVTLHDVDAFIHFQADRGLQSCSINRSLTAITSFYRFLADEDPTIECPVLRHRHFLRKPQRLPRAVASPDLQRFFAVIDDPRDRAIFLLMLRCGLRIAEVAALQRRDLFLDEAAPHIRVFGKNSKERTVYVSPQLLAALRVYLAVRPTVEDESVFLSYQQRGLSTTAIHKRLMRYRTAADVHLTAHQLRHSFANDLVEADVPVTTIQKLLGHAWLTSTQTYVAANDRKVQADFFHAAEQLDSWLTAPGAAS